jgi:hypothetical protein
MTIPITKEYNHTWEYIFNHLFSPLQRYSMYLAMFLWAVWGISGFALLTTNATLQGVAFAKEVGPNTKTRIQPTKKQSL